MPIDIANSTAAANAYANTAKGISAPGIEAPKGQSFTDYIKQAAVESVETLHAGEKASADAVIGKASLTDVVEAVLLGLAVGCVTWWGYQKLDLYRLSYRVASILEVFLLLLLAASVIFYKAIWFLAPVFLYSLIVLLFAREAGWLSVFTKKKFFLFMGKISYSLYLNHLMVLLLLQSSLLVMGVTHDMLINNRNPLVLPVGLVVYFGILIPCSAWTYKNVELYWQKKRDR